MSQTLAQLDDELIILLEHLDSESIEDRTVAEELLTELLPQLDRKIDSYMGVVSHYSDKIANIDREIARLQTRKAIEQGKQDYLKNRLQAWLELRSDELGNKGKKVEGNLYKVSLVANGGKLSLELNKEIEISQIPAAFTTTTEITKLDTDKLREFMTANDVNTITTNSGEIIASLLPRGKHLRIS
jgi:Siphovirus Gp157